ncbi:hypothetical protein [Ottowia sp. VDI28]|uniref:hypothetical protein n=1 Tax=Ottowia sp. VDI28 TaxID=3133968 RepID=UPI003C2DBD73
MSTMTPPKATGQIIWDTMVGMREANQAISRNRLQEITGLKYTLIDDHVTRLIEEGRMRRVIDGVYELVDPMPEPRPVSVTHLPDGMTIIECGDGELRMWPPEVRKLGLAVVGNAMQFSQLQSQHDMAAMLTEATVRNRALADRLSDLEREYKALLEFPGLRAYVERQRKAQAAGQGDLLGE